MPVAPLPVVRALPNRSLRMNGRDTRVFICDDDQEFSTEIASSLTLSGFQVRTLQDGKSPVEIFELFRPDIVFLDIFMPPPDGFEVMDHIGRDTRRDDFTLALLSGADGTLLEVAGRFCQARGIRTAAILRKPVSLSAILQVCKNHFGNAAEA